MPKTCFLRCEMWVPMPTPSSSNSVPEPHTPPAKTLFSLGPACIPPNAPAPDTPCSPSGASWPDGPRPPSAPIISRGRWCWSVIWAQGHLPRQSTASAGGQPGDLEPPPSLSTPQCPGLQHGHGWGPSPSPEMGCAWAGQTLRRSRSARGRDLGRCQDPWHHRLCPIDWPQRAVGFSPQSLSLSPSLQGN